MLWSGVPEVLFPETTKAFTGGKIPFTVAEAVGSRARTDVGVAEVAMCTRALWPEAAGAVLVGRSMDWPEDPETNLWAFPRGTPREDGVGGTLTWTARYASMAAGAHDLMTVDGFNEAGLAAHQLFLLESEYGGPADDRPRLSLAVWLQYLLDNFATVAEVVAWTEEAQPTIAAQDDPFTGQPIGLHLALDDAHGDSAIIEYLEGHPHIHHGRAYTVMTNSPPFDQQLELLEANRSASERGELPGGTGATDRFIRADHYLSRLPAPSGGSEAVASLLSVMRNVSQPFRTPDPAAPFASQTQWRTVADLTRRIFVFESSHRPNVVWAHLDDLDMAPGAPVLRLNLVSDHGLEGGLVGDVTDRFEASESLRFMPAVDAD